MKDRGKLENGYLADMVTFPVHDYKEILYKQGSIKPNRVWKKGTLVMDKNHD
jgi:imidazolonepropionase